MMQLEEAMYEDNDATGVSTEATGAPSSADLNHDAEKQGAVAAGQANPAPSSEDLANWAGEIRGAANRNSVDIVERQAAVTEEDDLPEDSNQRGQTAKVRKSDEEVLDQLDRIEAKLDQVIEMLRPGAQTSAKVPYVAPEQPAGLSPNQILANAQANSQAAAE